MAPDSPGFIILRDVTVPSRGEGDELERGRDAYTRHAWREAFEGFRELDAREPLAGEDLSRLAEAAWFAGEPETALDVRRRAYSAFLAVDDPCSAALMAVRAAVDYFDRMEIAIGQGWLARASRLLEQEEPCPAHGWEAFVQVIIANHSGDAAEARDQARRREPDAEADVEDVELPQLADPAEQGEAAAGKGGSGVGLAVVAELARAHGGRVDVANVPGRGARFTIQLPRR